MPQVTLTLKTEEGIARPEEMREALRKLFEAGALPSTGIKMTFAVGSKDDAEYLEEQLSEALEERAWVIEAEIEVKTKDSVRRKLDKPATPMEAYIKKLDGEQRPSDEGKNSLERGE